MKFTGCCYCRLEAGVRLREKEMFMAEMEENPLLLLLFVVLEGGIQLLCGFCLILILIWSSHSQLQQEVTMGRECRFELVTALLPKVTVQRLKLLKLAVLDLLKTQCW